MWRSERAGTGLRAYLDHAQQQRLAAEDSLILDAASTAGRTLPYGVQTLLLALMRVGPQVVGVLSLDYGDVAHTYAAEEIALAATFWFTLPLLDAASPGARDPTGDGEGPARKEEVDAP